MEWLDPENMTDADYAANLRRALSCLASEGWQIGGQPSPPPRSDARPDSARGECSAPTFPPEGYALTLTATLIALSGALRMAAEHLCGTLGPYWSKMSATERTSLMDAIGTIHLSAGRLRTLT